MQIATARRSHSLAAAFRLATTLAVGVAFLAFLPLQQAALAEELSESQIMLRDAGLTRLGNFWAPPAEGDFRGQLELMPKLERAYFASRDAFNGMQGEQDRLRTQLRNAKEILQRNNQKVSDNGTSPGERQQINSESDRLNDQVSRIEREIRSRLSALDETTPYAAAAIERVNARNALAIALLRARRTLNEVDAAYAKLGETEGLKEAAKNDSAILGPIENYHLKAERRLTRLEGEVFGDGAPVYRRSGQIRLSLIVNEEFAATFSYQNGNHPAIVPNSIAQRSGVTIDAAAPRMNITIDDIEYSVRKAKIVQLRVGKHLFNNVEAVVLPAEAEHLGGRICHKSFGNNPPSLDENRLWLSVGP